MGNCLNGASKQQGRRGGVMPEEQQEESLSEIRRLSQVLEEEEEEEREQPVTAEGVKVKIVLTRAELEWLMAQLKSGEQRLEDVLHHMRGAMADTKTARASDGGWRPCLESILEYPEAAAGVDLATAVY